MTLADEINRMIATTLENSEFTSASDNMAGTVKNKLIQINQQDNPDLEAELEKTIQGEDEDGAESPLEIKTGKQNKLTSDKVKRFDAGQVGDISRMPTEQFKNITDLASDPIGFVIGKFTKKLGKGVVKGGIIGLLAIALVPIIQGIIEEFQKPGRLFDIRFKRNLKRELLLFRKREEKEKLRRGASRVIVTTIPRLRGGANQTFDSFRSLGANIPVFQGDSFDLRPTQGSPGSISKQQGIRNKKGGNAFTGN